MASIDCFDHVIGIPVQDIFTHLLTWLDADTAIVIKYELDYAVAHNPGCEIWLDLYEDSWELAIAEPLEV